MNLHVYDDENQLLLTGYNLPPHSVFSGQSGSGDDKGVKSNWSRLPDDEGIARVVTSLARKEARGYLETRSKARTRPDIGLATWVLRRGSDRQGRLESWFTDERGTARYRVFIHRTPRRYQGCSLPLIWDDVYANLASQGIEIPAQPAVSSQALRAGAVLLGELLMAYRSGSSLVAAFFSKLRHPYRYVE